MTERFCDVGQGFGAIYVAGAVPVAAGVDDRVAATEQNIEGVIDEAVGQVVPVGHDRGVIDMTIGELLLKEIDHALASVCSN